jgi:hypothetical protein
MTNNPPSINELMQLPVAEGARYLLDDYDITKVRARIYLMNKENAAGWRWRTTKIATKTKSKNKQVIKNLIHTLVVWRIK